MSTIYEAFFRYYPTEREVELMCREFSVQRLAEVRRDCMDPKELSAAFRMQADEVDYRAFCKAIGASGDAELQEVEKPKTDDPAWKEYSQEIDFARNHAAFKKLLAAHRRFRFDFKSFLQARDKRGIH